MSTSLPRRPLVEVCDDPQLFGFKLWPRQRELLDSIDRGARIHVLALGRRSGKTTMAALVLLHGCLFRPDLDAMVRSGERRYAVGVATNLAQARLLVAAARSIIESSPLLAELLEAATEDELRFANGTVLRAFPCSSRGGRGWPISHLLMDEAAHFLTETEGPATAERVWEALVPSTAQFGDGARIILASTPYGQDGLFADLFNRAQSGELADAQAHHAPTADVNPTITADFLATEERRDPNGHRSEYLAEFTGSGMTFLDLDRFEVYERGELEPRHGTGWIAGLDPAFSSDPFGIALVGRHPDDPQQLVVGSVSALRPRRIRSIEHRAEVEREMLDQVAMIVKRYGARAVSDQHQARVITEYLSRHGINVAVRNMTAASKTAAFQELRSRLYAGTLDLYAEPDLMAELRRLRTKYRAGSAAVEIPRVGKSHGDMAQALALAVYEHSLNPMSTGTIAGARRYGDAGPEGWVERTPWPTESFAGPVGDW